MYDLDYVEYRGARLVKVKCMRCGVTVKEIHYHDYKIPELVQLDNCRRGFIKILINGSRSYIEPFLCADCAKEPLDVEKIFEQVKHGWKLEEMAKGVSEEIANMKISNIRLEEAK